MVFVTQPTELPMIPPRDMAHPVTIQEEGWVAFYDGKGTGQCPHTDDESRKAWLEGWHAATEWFANE